MKNFLKPTKVTWITMLLLCCIVFIGFLFSSGIVPDTGRLTDIFAASVIIFLILPVVLFGEVVGIRLYSSGYFLPMPTAFGYVVNIAVSLIFFYVLGSIVSKIWYKLKPKKLLTPDY